MNDKIDSKENNLGMEFIYRQKVFTDDDLKRLKKDGKEALAFYGSVDVSILDFNALMFRLEAAENVAMAVAQDGCELDHSGNCQAHFLENPCSVSQWRKVSGRGYNG